MSCGHEWSMRTPEHARVQRVHRLVVGVELDGQQHVARAHHLGRLERHLDPEPAISAKAGRTCSGTAHRDCRRSAASATCRASTHPLEVGGRADRGHRGAQVAGDRSVEQQRPWPPARRRPRSPIASPATIFSASRRRVQQAADPSRRVRAASVHICPSSPDSCSRSWGRAGGAIGAVRPPAGRASDRSRRRRRGARP